MIYPTKLPQEEVQILAVESRAYFIIGESLKVDAVFVRGRVLRGCALRAE